MHRRIWMLLLSLCAAMLLGGCGLKTLDELYCLPRRSETYDQLQSAIDQAMADMEYAAPVSGENQQNVQTADLDGDGTEEYIVFARGTSEKPLQILSFKEQGEDFTLYARMESLGSAFEQVEYVDIDGQPGLEIMVGRRVSDQVLKSLSVYTFSNGEAEQLLSVSYAKFLACDLDEDGKSDILLLQPGQADEDNGIAVLYSYESGEMTRSKESAMSRPVDSVKRIMLSQLQSGEPAVYVASSVDESAIITDIFAVKWGEFTNISLSSESGTSVQTLRNYYIYADDIDGDGVLELPSLITMHAIEMTRQAVQQYLIRWYAVDIRGRETDKLYTFHNFGGGWYVDLDGSWAERVSVSQDGGNCLFYLWDEEFQDAQLLLSVFALTGANREEEAAQDGQFVLYRADGVTYSARLETLAREYAIAQEYFTSAFHLIQSDWKTGET